MCGSNCNMGVTFAFVAAYFDVGLSYNANIWGVPGAVGCTVVGRYVRILPNIDQILTKNKCNKNTGIQITIIGAITNQYVV